jgi:hypothetical protein
LSRFERSGWRCACKLRGGEKMKLEFSRKLAMGWLKRAGSLVSSLCRIPVLDEFRS